MGDIHAALLARVDDYIRSASADEYPVDEPLTALRAAVELHAPVPCKWAGCLGPEAHKVCKTCGPMVNSPCEEIQVIAEKLGVNDQELNEKEERRG